MKYSQCLCLHLISFVRFLFPKSPISGAKASSVNSSKHNGRNMVCFDEQTPKLIDGDNILRIYFTRLDSGDRNLIPRKMWN